MSDEDRAKAPPMSARRARWLRVGAVLGACMVVVPLVTAAVGIASASRVPEGLRGATHLPEMQGKVRFALSSASLVPFLAPPGVLLYVLCALSLADERRRRRKAVGAPSPDSGG